MSRAAGAKLSLQASCQQIAALLASAIQFVAHERGETTVRKWIGRDIAKVPEDRMIAMGLMQC